MNTVIINDQVKETFLELPVNTYDIDVAGHVNNIVYVRWLEELRVGLFNKYLPISSLLARDLFPVVASTNINYKKQLMLGDRPEGRIWIEKMYKGIFILKAEISADNSCIASATQKCVIINLKTNKIQNISITD
jgi:acyl-CoA thioester hydrolase